MHQTSIGCDINQSYFSKALKMVRPICPDCCMNMIVVDGFRLDFKVQTFECLRCGFTKNPASNQIKRDTQEDRLSRLS